MNIGAHRWSLLLKILIAAFLECWIVKIIHYFLVRLLWIVDLSLLEVFVARICWQGFKKIFFKRFSSICINYVLFLFYLCIIYVHVYSLKVIIYFKYIKNFYIFLVYFDSVKCWKIIVRIKVGLGMDR